MGWKLTGSSRVPGKTGAPEKGFFDPFEEIIIGEGGIRVQEVYSRTDLESIILSLLKKYHAEKAILFGSYARKEADEKSDIDLMIVGGPAFDPTDVFSLAEDLHRRTGKSVDVYEQCEINQESDFYQTILREGVSIAA